MLDAAQLNPHIDPRTKDAEKYFLGDRFHEKNVSFFKLVYKVYVNHFIISVPTLLSIVSLS